MNKNLKNLKKVTCLLGISFLLIGMIPFGKVVQAAPETVAGKIEIGPNLFSSSGLATGLNKSADGEPCNGHGNCQSKNCYENVCRTKVNCAGSWSACSEPCGDGTQTYIITTPAQYGGSQCSKAAGATKTCNLGACGDDDDDTGDDDDDDETCTPAGTEICPTTPCGLDASELSDGCDGTVFCNATAPCAPTCKPKNEPCTQDSECCSGDCNINSGKCKPGGGDGGSGQCKSENAECSINESGKSCCEGLVCVLFNPNSGNHKCVKPSVVCGNGIVEEGEQCDDGNTTAGDGCSDTCQTEGGNPVCGDGELDDGEECDDGNTTAGDGCSDTCQIEGDNPVCGDGVVESGEQCDGSLPAGQYPDGSYCTDECKIYTPPVCGDNEINQTNEVCDGTAGVKDNETCSANCEVIYTCGDEIVNQAFEECDGEDFCTAECTLKEAALLILDPYCIDETTLQWTVENDNGFAVPNVSVDLDGSTATYNPLGTGTTFIGTTGDGPSSHMMSVTWPDGSASLSSTLDCATPGGDDDDDDDVPGGGGTPVVVFNAPIPVTGAGGPTEPLIIPVTGVDLTLNLAGLQRLFTTMGFMLFGITMVLEGVDKRLKSK